MQEIKIAEYLQTLRKQKGLTQQDVANHLNISNKTVSKWENAQQLPDILTLKALAELYGVTVDEILSGGKNISESKKREVPINSLLEQKAKNKWLIFIIIGLACHIVGMIIDLILAIFNYRLVGFSINLFFIIVTTLLIIIPYLLFSNEEKNYQTIIKLKELTIKTALIVGIGSIFFTVTVIFVAYFHTILVLLFSAILSLVSWHTYNKHKDEDILDLVAKLIAGLIVVSSLLTYIYTLYLPISDTYSVYSEELFPFFILYSLLLIAFVTLFIIQKTRFKYEIYLAISSFVIYIIYEVLASVFGINLSYSDYYIVLMLACVISLIVINCLNYKKIDSIDTINKKLKISNRLIVILSIINVVLCAIVIIISFYLPIGKISDENVYLWNYGKTRLLYCVFIPYILAIVVLFIPKVKYVLSPILLFVSIIGILLSVEGNNIHYNDSLLTIFYTYMAIDVIILVTVIASLVIKKLSKKRYTQILLLEKEKAQ